jgi:hypothetical protein
MKQRNSLIVFLVFLSLFVSGGVALAQGFAGWWDIEPATRFRNIVRFDQDVTLIDDLSVADALTVADLSASDDITATDDLVVGDRISTTNLLFSERSALTIGESGTITPTGVYQRLTSASNVGTSSITGHVEGRILILHNIGSNTITLTDTSTLKLSGNAALGNLDSVVLMSDGTNWIQIAPEGDN